MVIVYFNIRVINILLLASLQSISMISQQITEYVYEQYQTQDFYRKYLKESNSRVDGRGPTQHRDIKVSICRNSVTVARGSTIVIAQIRTALQTVTYSPVSESYDKPLLSVNVQMISHGNKFERNAAKAVERYVEDFIDWKAIQPQIVEQVAQKKQQILAHVGEVLIKIADSDGSLEETVLLAAQFLLWTATFAKIGSEDKQEVFHLALGSFWFPVKYCEILDEVLFDPIKSEEKASNFELTFVKNLTKADKTVKVQKLHGINTANVLPSALVEGLQKLFLAEIEKLPFDIKDVQSKSKTLQRQVITISGL